MKLLLCDTKCVCYPFWRNEKSIIFAFLFAIAGGKDYAVSLLLLFLQ